MVRKIKANATERCAPSNFINGLAKDEEEKSKLSWRRIEVPHFRRVYMIFKNIKMQFAWLITFYLFCFLISVFTFLYDNVMGSVIAFRCTHLSMTNLYTIIFCIVKNNEAV